MAVRRRVVEQAHHALPVDSRRQLLDAVCHTSGLRIISHTGEIVSYIQLVAELVYCVVARADHPEKVPDSQQLVIGKLYGVGYLTDKRRPAVDVVVSARLEDYELAAPEEFHQIIECTAGNACLAAQLVNRTVGRVEQ